MINGISSNRSIQTMTQNRNDTSEQEIKLLENQKDALQKQIDNIKNGSGDVNTKQQLIKPIQEQIQEIDAEIQQKQVDSVDSKNDNSNGKSSTNTKFNGINGQNNNKYSGEDLLLDASKIYKQIKTVNSVRSGLMDKANELNSDADVDEALRNYKSAENNRSNAAQSKGRAISLESKIGKLNGEMNKDVKNEIEKNGNINVNKDVQPNGKIDDKQIANDNKNLKEYNKNVGEDSKEDKDKSINVFV
ncbi:FlxA-like family protein [Clostridium sp. AWRP]|uniref:FlxA-like family protein n=1 Tax=Clostridium sp. AWRP TaxID=2212991 RepID=UPI0015862F89|nr:FlxA-like family protein [Clostridium sp. AWRP]